MNNNITTFHNKELIFKFLYKIIRNKPLIYEPAVNILND